MTYKNYIFNSFPNNMHLYVDKKPRKATKTKKVVTVKKPKKAKYQHKITKKLEIIKVIPIAFRDLMTKYPNFNAVYFASEDPIMNVREIIECAQTIHYKVSWLNYNNIALKFNDMLDRYYLYKQDPDFKLIMLELNHILYKKPWKTTDSEGFQAFCEIYPRKIDRLRWIAINELKRKNKDPEASKRSTEQYFSGISTLRLRNLMAILDSMGYHGYNVDSVMGHAKTLIKSQDRDIISSFIEQLSTDPDHDMLEIDMDILIDQYDDQEFWDYLNDKQDDFLLNS